MDWSDHKYIVWMLISNTNKLSCSRTPLNRSTTLLLLLLSLLLLSVAYIYCGPSFRFNVKFLIERFHVLMHFGSLNNFWQAMSCSTRVHFNRTMLLLPGAAGILFAIEFPMKTTLSEKQPIRSIRIHVIWYKNTNFHIHNTDFHILPSVASFKFNYKKFLISGY